MTGTELLREYIERHNHGVRTGEWEPMLKHFAADAELVFEGVPIGPFRGIDEIESAYRERGPDDEVDVQRVREEDEVVAADYTWAREPGHVAGELRLTRTGDRIARLVVTFAA